MDRHSASEFFAIGGLVEAGSVKVEAAEALKRVQQGDALPNEKTK